MARGRAVGEQPVGSEIIGKVEFGPQVTIEITCCNGICPTVIRLVIQNSLHLPKVHGWLCSCCGRGPQKQVLLAAIVSARPGIRHLLDARAMRVKHVSTVGEVVGNHQVHVSIAIQVRPRHRVGVPASSSWHQFARHVALPGEMAQDGFLAMEEEDGRASPVVDKEIHQTIFVEISGDATCRRHGDRIIRQRCRVQRKRRIACGGAGYRGDDDLVGAGVDVAQIVRQPIAIEVAQGHRGTEGRDPGGEALQAGVNCPHRCQHLARQRRQGQMSKVKLPRQLGALGRGQIRWPGQRVEQHNQRYHDKMPGISLNKTCLDAHPFISWTALLPISKPYIHY